MRVLPITAPIQVQARHDAGHVELLPAGDNTWDGAGISVTVTAGAVALTAKQTAVSEIRLTWEASLPGESRILGDHWERGYGDLQWCGFVPERVLPWYFLVHHAAGTTGYGVKTGPHAFCGWQVNPHYRTLILDVRNGGRGVRLNGRTLEVAQLVAFAAGADVSTFRAAQAFCRALCDRPRLPSQPVYGANNWYHAYGRSSHGEILADTRLLTELAPAGSNRPYMVIDDGWQAAATLTAAGACPGGPWTQGNAQFPDMPGLARQIRELGAQPGLWVRPLVAGADIPDDRLLVDKDVNDLCWKHRVMDPSRPETIAYVHTTFARFREWGYALVKHDFTTFDLLGRWGFDMSGSVTRDGWGFSDDSRTTAEIILALYSAMRAGAGNATLLGCNTLSHLSAGLFEIQRTGDDTSGKEWARTRKMGVNTLAFRMPQHGAFYAVDADCVGLTEAVPWHFNRQWLDLLARSGTPLFVSAAPTAVGPAQRAALVAAFATAAAARPVAEPLDWMNTTCPETWSIDGTAEQYHWYDPRQPEVRGV